MATRVQFVKDYIYTPTKERRVSTKFRASRQIRLVNDECAEKAIEGGYAVPVGGTYEAKRPVETKAPTTAPRAPRRRRAKVIVP